MRGYRMHGPVGSMQSSPKPAGITEVVYQIQRFHSFLWASGGCFSDFYIHIIDHCCWMKNAWPVKAQALGGRHYRGDYVDQNFDTYSVEYTFADDTKFIMDGRCMAGCSDIYNSFAHGTKGTAIVSSGGDCGGPSATFKGQGSSKANMLWESKVPPDEGNPYQNEWNDLVDAIRNDKPYNEAKRGVEASLVTSMGRMAAHTGQDRHLRRDAQLRRTSIAPDVDKLTMDGPAPADGRRQRQVSRAAAGHRHEDGILSRVRIGEGISGGLSQFSFDENGTVPFGCATVIVSPILSRLGTGGWRCFPGRTGPRTVSPGRRSTSKRFRRRTTRGRPLRRCSV